MGNGIIADVSTRSISEILIEADQTEELSVLCDCWKEIVKNKYKYSLAQIWFAKEHLEELARKMAKRDVQNVIGIYDRMVND